MLNEKTQPRKHGAYESTGGRIRETKSASRTLKLKEGKEEAMHQTTPFKRVTKDIDVLPSKDNAHTLPGVHNTRKARKGAEFFSPRKMMHKRLLYDLERMQNLLDKAKRNRTKEKLLSEVRLSSLPRKHKTMKENSEDAIS